MLILFGFLVITAESMMLNLNNLSQRPKAFGYYKADADGITWFDAIKLCEKKGGMLAYFDSPHDHLVALRSVPMDARVWIGYSDLEREGEWKTVTNEIPSYMKWVEGQPDDRFRNEDCAMIVMGPWGRGRMMDAKCDEKTGVPEWSILASYMCRFNGPLRGPDGEKLEDEEEVALPDWATTVPPKPAVAEKVATETVNALVTSLVNSSALRELETEIDVTQDRAATNAKEINLLKTNLSDYSYDLQMITNSTRALKNDNKLIFEQMNALLNTVNQVSLEQKVNNNNNNNNNNDNNNNNYNNKAGTVKANLIENDNAVVLKSSVADEEQKFYVTKQKDLNKQIFAGLQKQKAQIKRLKMLVGDTADSEEIVDIEGFIELQKAENLALKNQVSKLTMDSVMLKRKVTEMNNLLVEFRNKLNG